MTRHRPGRNPAAQQSPGRAEARDPLRRKHGEERAVNRRSFIALIGGAAAAWPLAAGAQQRACGASYSCMGSPKTIPKHSPALLPFEKGIQTFDGWRPQHQNRASLFRWRYRPHPGSHGGNSGLGTGRHCGTAGPPVIAALNRRPATIPIVFSVVNDPAGQGFVASLARPGGNITESPTVDFPIIGNGWRCSGRSSQAVPADDAHVQSVHPRPITPSFCANLERPRHHSPPSFRQLRCGRDGDRSGRNTAFARRAGGRPDRRT